MRQRLFVCLLFLTIPSALHAAWGRTEEPFKDATPEEKAMKGVALAPGASAAVLRWVRHRDDQSGYEAEYVRMKIFGEEGKKYGDIELFYLPGFTSIKDVRARTIHADGTVVPFKGQVYDKLIVRAGGLRLQAKTFSLPDVQPGSILEYGYAIEWPQEMLRSTRWNVQREVPVLHESLWLRAYEKRFSNLFTYTGLPTGKAPARTGDHYELELDDVPAFEKEPYAPPDSQLKARVDFFYTLGKLDPDEFWRDAGKNWADAIEDFIGDRRYVREQAQLVVAGADTPEAKLRKIYARVQQVRNLSFEKDKTEQEEKRENLRDNKSAEDVLRNGYGYRSEINRLFVAMARAAGLDAVSVRVASRDDVFFAKNMLDRGQLDTEVAAVTLDGAEPKYFDPGTPFAPYGLLSWEKTGVVGMRFAKKTGGTFVQTPDMPPTFAVTERKATLRLDPDAVRGTATLTFRGQEALRRRLAGRNEDDAANRKTIEDEVKKWFPDGSTVKVTKLTNLRGTEEPLIAEVDLDLPNLGSVVGSRAIVPLAIFSTAQKNPFAAERRKNPVYFENEFQTEDEVTLQIPEGYAIESLPKNIDERHGAVGFQTWWAQKDNAVTFKRKLYLGTVFIDVPNYRIIRAFFSRLGTADQESLVLKKAVKS